MIVYHVFLLAYLPIDLMEYPMDQRRFLSFEEAVVTPFSVVVQGWVESKFDDITISKHSRNVIT